MGNILTNIYEEIEKFNGVFRNTAEFAVLKEAIELVSNDDEARQLFVNFRDVQVQLQQKQMAGEEILEDEIMHAQKVAQLAQQNEKILTMLEAEMNLSKIVEELNRTLFTPIQEMYDQL